MKLNVQAAEQEPQQRSKHQAAEGHGKRDSRVGALAAAVSALACFTSSRRRTLVPFDFPHRQARGERRKEKRDTQHRDQNGPELDAGGGEQDQHERGRRHAHDTHSQQARRIEILRLARPPIPAPLFVLV